MGSDGFMHASIERLLDILFPPSKRVLRVRSYTAGMIVPSPLLQRLGRHSILSLASYDDEVVKTAVRTLKFEASMHAAELFGQLLADYLLEAAADSSLFDSAPSCIVPIPLGKKRLRERGHNQVEMALRTLPQFGITLPLRNDILVRVRETVPQTSLGRAERLKNVDGAFGTLPEADLAGMHIYLIDDVMTTGATLSSATSALEKAGARVTPIALCRA